MNARFGLVLFGCTLAAFVVADDPKQAELAKKPQWQRLLTGEDAKKAEKLDKRVLESQEKDDYATAIKEAEELLAIRTNRQGSDHHETMTVKYDLVALRKVAMLDAVQRREWRSTMQTQGEAYQLMAKGLHSQAVAILRKILVRRLEVLGDDHPDVAVSYGGIVVSLDVLGKHVEAYPLHRRSLDICRGALGEDHPDTATSYSNVAINLDHQGKHGEAEPLYRTALEIRRRIFGEDRSETASSYLGIAFNLHAQGKLAEAKPLYRTALEVTRRAFGEDHVQTATCINNLGMNLKDQGEFAEALTLLRRASDIRRKLNGENHPDMANSFNNIATALYALGKYDEAEEHNRKALAVYTRLFDEDHPFVASGYNNLGMALYGRERYAEALAHLNKALEIRVRAIGENHADLAMSCTNIASALDALGKHAEARTLHEKAIDIYRRALGESHPHTSVSYVNSAMNQTARGKRAEAKALLRRAIFASEASRLTGAVGLDRATLDRFNPRLLMAAIQQSDAPISAWTEIEHALSRGLLDRQSEGTRDFSPTEEAEVSDARARLSAVQPQILALSLVPKPAADDRDRNEKLLVERREAEERLATVAVATSMRRVSDGNAILAAVPTDAAMLYWVDISKNDTQEHFVCVVRAAGGSKWERLPGTGPDKAWTKADTELPQKFRTALAGTASAAEVASLAKRLHDQRIAPVLKHLDGAKTL